MVADEKQEFKEEAEAGGANVVQLMPEARLCNRFE